MKLIVGLGNPGKKYENTRHNIGFMVIDEFAKHCNAADFREKFKALITETIIHGEKVILMKPQTYMNLSGESVRLALDFYKLDLSDIIVIYDDLDLNLAKLRLRLKGSSGGHNGIKSISQHLASENFKRLKFGIDKNPVIPVVDYVLGKFTKDELQAVNEGLKMCINVLNDFTNLSFTDLMTKYNKK